MNLRFKAFGLHLFASVLVLTLTFVVLYYGWYAWPAWYLLKADPIAALLVLSVLLGPLVTLLVSSPSKPRHLLRMNLGVIIALQLSALSMGTWVLWQGRPMFFILTIDRIEMITASEFEADAKDLLPQKSIGYTASRFSQVAWIWAPLPENPEEKEAIVSSAIVLGKDITVMPQYFRSWDAGLDDLRRQIHPFTELKALLKLDPTAYSQLEQSFSQESAKLGWLRLDGSKRGGVMVFERDSGQPLRFIVRE